MGFGHHLTDLVAKCLPFHNRRTVVPLGSLSQGGASAPLVIVASLARSGTHVLMDAVFNHFSDYRRTPLYLDLLLCEWHGRFPEQAELEGCGAYVVKTHYDGVVYAGAEHERAIRELLKLGAVVLVLERDRDALRRSQRTFHGEGFDEAEFERQYDAFFDYWGPKQTMRVRFEDMIEEEGFKRLIGDLEAHLGPRDPGEWRLPKGRDQALGNYRNKLLTRIMGGRAPVISTGIGFRKTRHPGGERE